MADDEKGEPWVLLLLALLLGFGLSGGRRRKAGGPDVVVSVRVVGGSCFLNEQPIDCDRIADELAPGSVPRIDATHGSQGVVDDLEDQLRAAGFKVITVSQ